MRGSRTFWRRTLTMPTGDRPILSVDMNSRQGELVSKLHWIWSTHALVVCWRMCYQML